MEPFDYDNKSKETTVEVNTDPMFRELLPVVIYRWQELAWNIFVVPWSKERLPVRFKPTFTFDTEKQELDYERMNHWTFWIIGWLITFIGIIGVGIFAPYIALVLPLPQQYQDYIVMLVSFAGGFFWQLLSITLLFASMMLYETDIVRSFTVFSKFSNFWDTIFIVIVWIVDLLVLLGLPVFSIYWYVTHFAPSHNLTGKGIIGAVVIKIVVTFGLPLLKGVISGVFIRFFFRWLRGEQKPTEIT